MVHAATHVEKKVLEAEITSCSGDKDGAVLGQIRFHLTIHG